MNTQSLRGEYSVDLWGVNLGVRRVEDTGGGSEGVGGGWGGRAGEGTGGVGVERQ